MCGLCMFCIPLSNRQSNVLHPILLLLLRWTREHQCEYSMHVPSARTGTQSWSSSLWRRQQRWPVVRRGRRAGRTARDPKIALNGTGHPYPLINHDLWSGSQQFPSGTLGGPFGDTSGTPRGPLGDPSGTTRGKCPRITPQGPPLRRPLRFGPFNDILQPIGGPWGGSRWSRRSTFQIWASRRGSSHRIAKCVPIIADLLVCNEPTAYPAYVLTRHRLGCRQ